MVVARDIAHAKIAERLDAGEPMPAYLRDHPVYYAGPAKTPEGYASGSFGPTTAGRMDSYVERFQAAGRLAGHAGQGEPVGRRHRGVQAVTAASTSARSAAPRPGWPRTASPGSRCSSTPNSGMEAVWKIEVSDFPAFIVVDDKGNDFFAEAARAAALRSAATPKRWYRSAPIDPL